MSHFLRRKILYAVIGAVLGVALVASSVCAFEFLNEQRPKGDGVGGFVYAYQSLIGAIVALAAALITVLIYLHQRRELEKKAFDRFFVFLGNFDIFCFLAFSDCP